MTALVGIEAPDAELVVLATAGDRDAFRVLFDRHAHRVAGACRQKLRSQTDVDDAVQEAFARALANLDQLRDPSQFGAWVRSIAVRACMDHHRASRRVVVVDQDTHAERADTAPLPDEVVEGFERDETIRSLLAQLGERDRQALYMRHINEAGVPEIADELGLTEGSTRVMLTRARERLRVVAAGLGSFIPWTWRRWIREHLPASAPALEALAVVMAVGMAGGFLPPPAEDQRPTQVQAASSQERPRKVNAVKPAAPVKAGDRSAAPSAAADHAGSGSAGDAPGGGNAAPAEAAPQSPRVLKRVKDSVQVQREYPKEEETQELLDITVISAEDQNSLRLYGNQVTKSAQKSAEPASEAADELFGGSED